MGHAESPQGRGRRAPNLRRLEVTISKELGDWGGGGDWREDSSGRQLAAVSAEQEESEDGGKATWLDGLLYSTQ